MPVPNPVARALDLALEATVVGSFSAIGPAVRSRVEGWPDPVPPRSLEGAVAVVTGATSGLGEATARLLAGGGASVVLVGRDRGRAEHVEATLRAEGAGGEVTHHLADVGDLAAVRHLADRVAAEHPRVDVLVHAAGALTAQRHTNPDGVEQTLATHVLGPHLLTALLVPHLERAAPGRVVWVTSGGMYTQRLELEHLELGPDDYDGTTAYARAKRAQVVLTEAWAQHVDPRQVVVHAMHPGWADTSGVAASLPRFHRLLRPILRSPRCGADTIAWLATTPEARSTSGDLWLDRRRRRPHRVPWTRGGATPGELWDWCQARTA